MTTILGAGGAIGSELVKQLAGNGTPVRLVGRNPKLEAGATEAVCADLSDLDQTVRAVAGSDVVHLLAGLKYDLRVWKALWPKIMRNTIEACKQAGTKLVFFDNVYMYGKVAGPMTEETPFNPCSKKGEIRAQIATELLNEMKAGSLTALIARSADFYGPHVRNSGLNLLVFDKLAAGATPLLLLNDSVRHSFTFTPDAARGLVLLSQSGNAWNQTWHVPTTPDPPTGKEFVAIAAEALGVRAHHRVLGRPMLKIAGWFDRTIAELYEMGYQNDSEYLFDSTKFADAFHFEPTPYREGARIVAAAYKKNVSA